MVDVLVFAAIILGLMLAAIRLSRKTPPAVEYRKVWIFRDGKWVELKNVQSVTWHKEMSNDDVHRS